IGLRKSGGEHKPAGVAAVRRVEFTERTDLSRGDCPQRDLIRRVPAIGIRHGGRGKPVRRGALAVAQKPTELADILGSNPRTIVGIELAGIKQGSSAERSRTQRKESVIAEAAD